MKSITGFAIGLAAALAVPMAMADDDTTKKTTTSSTTTSTDSSTTATDTTMSTDTTVTTPTTGETYSASGTAYYGGGPTTTTTATTTTTTNDYYVHEVKESDHRHVRSGLGLNVFGTAGDQENARFGLGGRLEYVTKIGLAFGGSYTQHFTSSADRTAVRPLLAEVGWAIPVVNHLEVRPMVGLGYAFIQSTTTGDVNRPSDSSTTATTTMVNAGGVDVAPGAKVSYVARGFEVFTQPKYHFISGNNFAGLELGAGARF
jgi:hypothetical protein